MCSLESRLPSAGLLGRQVDRRPRLARLLGSVARRAGWSAVLPRRVAQQTGWSAVPTHRMLGGRADRLVGHLWGPFGPSSGTRFLGTQQYDSIQESNFPELVTRPSQTWLL
jgi:hypothetical protein